MAPRSKRCMIDTPFDIKKRLIRPQRIKGRIPRMPISWMLFQTLGWHLKFLVNQ